MENITKVTKKVLVLIGLVAGVLFVGMFILRNVGGFASPNPMVISGQGGSTAPMMGTSVTMPSSRGGVLGEMMPDIFYATDEKAAAPVSNATSTYSDGALTKKKVVKNASLSLLVQKAEETADGIRAIAERFDGFVADSQVYEVSAGVKSGQVTIRVPATRFTEALTEIKKLAVKIERETINAQDVTEQYIDMEARIKNLRAQEARYLKILDQSGTISETLAVVSQINNVRTQIEQLQGQLQYLTRQVDMSTITVSLTSEADVEVFGIRWRPLFVIKQSFRNLMSGITQYVDWCIAFLFKLPVLVLWIITFGLLLTAAWRIIRWLRDRFFADISAGMKKK